MAELTQEELASFEAYLRRSQGSHSGVALTAPILVHTCVIPPVVSVEADDAS